MMVMKIDQKEFIFSLERHFWHEQ